MLSDEAKRSVYDVYGKQGLEAGFAVTTHQAKNQKDLRRNWAKFQEQQVGNFLQHLLTKPGVLHCMDCYSFDCA